MANLLLERAAHQRPASTKRGALERLFTLMFQGFVYNQIWEDPEVDLEALALKPHHRLITIASGGCNVLNYLAADPAKIIAVDLNPNHIALTRLKLSALDKSAVLRGILPLLRQRQRQGQSHGLSTNSLLRVWTAKPAAIGKSTFRCTAGASTCSRAICIATACSGASSASCMSVARLHGKKLEHILLGAHARRTARRVRPLSSRRCSTTNRSACCRKAPFRFTRWAFRRRSMTNWSAAPAAMRSRCCASASKGWPAIFRSTRIISPGRPSGAATTWTNREAVPAYLRRDIYDVIRTRTDKVEVHHASLTDFLRTSEAAHRCTATCCWTRRTG